MSDIEKILFPFIGGLGLFIFGMHTMASGLQKTAGNKMRRWLEAVTSNRFLGVLVGFLVTAVIQSSSATTVMVVGFVNAGIMNGTQAIGLIMGANIGTTVTAWLVSSVEWARFLKPSTIAPLAVGVGAALAMFSQRDRYRRIGEIVVGFGVLFMGMDVMSSAVKPLSQSESFQQIFLNMGHNPFLGILAGAFVTAIIQSSSASVGILQSLASAGLVPWSAAVYIIMGQNIGTCVTALLSSIGTSKSAKSAAYMHLMFNVLGSVLFSIIAIVYFKFFNAMLGEQLIDMTQIGIVHTSFNIATTILLFPFANYIVALATRMAGVKSGAQAAAFVHLDDRILENPSFAIESCLREITRMCDLALDNLKNSCLALTDRDMDNVQKVLSTEDDIDLLQQGITRFLAKICSNAATSREENEIATSFFHTVNDIERVGDHAVNLAEVAQDMIMEDTRLSADATEEITRMITLTCSCFEHSVKALTTGNLELAAIVMGEEDASDELQKLLRHNHMMRLSSESCSPMAGVAFLDIISNLERVSDHAENIAQSVLRAAQKE